MDFDAVVKLLMVGKGEWHGPRLKPWEIQKCTIAEIAHILTPDEEKSQSGGLNQSDIQIAQYCEWYWSLTPEQMMAEAKAGRL